MAGFFSRWKKGPDDTIAVNAEDIAAATERVRAVLPITPLTRSAAMSERAGHEVYIKWENKHTTGSFKERGAVNALSLLDPKHRSQGVCAASLGNHALALSYHAARFSIPCTIVMPVNAPLVKIQSTKAVGANVILQGQTFVDAYDYALNYAAEHKLQFIPAYDHPHVVAGQGTAGIEILSQCIDFDSVIVPLGGGGLISGIALAIKAQRPEVFILGVQSDWAAKQSNEQQKRAPLIPAVSIADGIAVKRPGEITSPIVRKYVDKLVSLSEADIASGIIGFLQLERSVVEGAGGVGLPALLGGHLPPGCKRTVVVASGGNIDLNMLSRLIERDMGSRGLLLQIVVSVPDRPGSLHAVTGILARAGANILEAEHDRSFSEIPGNVDITFCLEVKDEQHRHSILKMLHDADISVRELH